MRASAFELRRPTFLHLLVVGAALLTYLFYPDDIVWSLVRHHSNSALLERIVFGIGALMFLSAAALDTWALENWTHSLLFARLIFALAFSLLLPLPGVIILISGEAFLIARLFANEKVGPTIRGRGKAFRRAASKWGLAVSMIVFTLTLQDRHVEIGGAISFCLWLALNIP